MASTSSTSGDVWCRRRVSARRRSRSLRFLWIFSVCFFSLALPRYSSVDICAEKLRYAITHAHLMDADFLLRQADGWEAMSP